MDQGRVDAEVNTAPAPEAPARPAPDAVPSVEPLHGPMDTAEDSLDGLQTAFGALSVKEMVSQPQPVKRKRGNESEKDAGEGADEGEEQGQDPTDVPTFEGAPSASGLHASPSPITTHSQPPLHPLPQPTSLWQRAQALLACLTTPPMAWAHLPLRSLRQLLPVSRWLPALRRVGMRLTIPIHSTPLEPTWKFLGMLLGCTWVCTPGVG